MKLSKPVVIAKWISAALFAILSIGCFVLVIGGMYSIDNHQYSASGGALYILGIWILLLIGIGFASICSEILKIGKDT